MLPLLSFLPSYQRSSTRPSLCVSTLKDHCCAGMSTRNPRLVPAYARNFNFVKYFVLACRLSKFFLSCFNTPRFFVSFSACACIVHHPPTVYTRAVRLLRVRLVCLSLGHWFPVESKCSVLAASLGTGVYPAHTQTSTLAAGGCQVYEDQLVGLMGFVGLEEDRFLLGLSGAGGDGAAGAAGRGGKHKRCLSSSFSSFSSFSSCSEGGGGGGGSGRKRRRPSSSCSGASFDAAFSDCYSPSPNKKGKNNGKGTKRMTRCRSSSFSSSSFYAADGLAACSSPPSTSSLKKAKKMDKRMPVGGCQTQNRMHVVR